MIETMSTTQVSALIDAANHALVKFKYRPETLRKFNAVWNRLLIYAHTKQVELFSVELAENFLRDTYHIEIGTQLARKDHGKARAIQVLMNVYLNQAIHLRRKHKEYRAPDTFRPVVDAFLKNGIDSSVSSSYRERILYELQNLIAFLVQQGIVQVSAVSPRDIYQYFQTLTEYSPATNSHSSRILRQFFTFTYAHGFSPQNLALFIPSIKRGKSQAALASVYTEEEIMRLLGAVDRANPIGKRDYAILLLATKLGLRRGDVQKLRLECLKWETNRIEIIQGKTGQILNLPILEDVGLAIIDYLKNGRPKILSEFVFLKHIPPYAELSGTGIDNIVLKYFRLADIQIPPGKKHGLHALRHSLASHLLENQTPIGVISAILGHLNSRTTDVYLKIDLRQLRTCALEVPHVAD